MGKIRKVRSPRVLTFIHEYVWGEHAGNGKECVLLAGLSRNHPENARKYACQLLRQKNVKELVDTESAEKEAQIKQKWSRVLEDQFNVATSDIGELTDENDKPIPFSKLPLHVRRAVLSVEIEHRTDGHGEDAEQYVVTKIKMHPKHPAAELFGKAAGKLKDKVEHTVLSHADLVLEADRLARETTAKKET
jgi:phage terminase small subunit